jgi:hypothetical protein
VLLRAGFDPTEYAAAVASAVCLPNVSAVLLDRLVDGASPEQATGLYDANGVPKPAAADVKRAIQAVARGAVVCPGRATRVTPTTLSFPNRLSRSSATAVDLGCDRDCLYLVALDRADGQPVVARAAIASTSGSSAGSGRGRSRRSGARCCRSADAESLSW